METPFSAGSLGFDPFTILRNSQNCTKLPYFFAFDKKNLTMNITRKRKDLDYIHRITKISAPKKKAWFNRKKMMIIQDRIICMIFSSNLHWEETRKFEWAQYCGMMP